MSTHDTCDDETDTDLCWCWVVDGEYGRVFMCEDKAVEAAILEDEDEVTIAFWRAVQ